MTLEEMIRDHLSNADHEDWCDARIHADCGQECNCFLGQTNRAIVAALDIEEFGGLTQFQRGWNEALGIVRERIAGALGITQETTHG